MRRWSQGCPTCQFRAAEGAQFKSFTVDSVDFSVTFAAGRKQYWLYFSISNHRHERLEIRPDALQLLSLAPYEREMLYRSADGVVASARKLGGGDALYSGPPVSVKLPGGRSREAMEAWASSPASTPDYFAMDRALHLAAPTVSDPEEIAFHLDEKMLRTVTIEPGQSRAGFVLFEAPPPLLFSRRRVELPWEPSAFLLTIPMGAAYIQIPFADAR